MSLHQAFADLAHATIDSWNRTPTDNIVQHNALYNRMKDRGNIKTRDEGGLEIVEPVVLLENPTIQNYSGYQRLNTGAQEVTALARFPWSGKAMHVSASGQELRINSGKAAMFRLVDTKLDAAMTTAENRMAIETYSDGTIADGLLGLAAYIQTNGGGTVGGIDSSLYANWKNQFRSMGAPGSVSASTIRGHFNKLHIACTIGNESPDLIICSNDIYTALEESMQLQMQYPYPYADRKQANFGFSSIKYKNADVVHDANVNFAENAERAYFLCTKYIDLFQHSKAKWDKEEERRPVDQDAVVIPFYWMGGTCIRNRRQQGVLFTA